MWLYILSIIQNVDFDMPDLYFSSTLRNPFFLYGIPGFQKRENEKNIARDPVYTDALIIKAVPGTHCHRDSGL